MGLTSMQGPSRRRFHRRIVFEITISPVPAAGVPPIKQRWKRVTVERQRAARLPTNSFRGDGGIQFSQPPSHRFVLLPRGESPRSRSSRFHGGTICLPGLFDHLNSAWGVRAYSGIDVTLGLEIRTHPTHVTSVTANYYDGNVIFLS